MIVSNSGPLMYPFFTLLNDISANIPRLTNSMMSDLAVVGDMPNLFCTSFTVRVSCGLS